MKKFITLTLSLFLIGNLVAQEATMPTVFELGTMEKQYDQLNETYSQTLLTASDGDIKTSFENWVGMMEAMEKYANKIKFDLNGVRIWLHVFWSEDGTIDHIGYLLRPDSKYVPSQNLGAFLSSFTRKYTFPVKSAKKYSHYTGVSFPVYVQKEN